MATLPEVSSIIPLHTIVPKPLTWLWRPRLPMGRLSLLVGHPDRGKSLFAATCAAHVSCGRPWPDGAVCPQGQVIFLEAEDALDETVVPRLQAADADLTQIKAWPERDLRHLMAQLPILHPKLLVISPLNTYMPKLNTWNDQEVRRFLQPLSDVALGTQTAILALIHPPKAKQSLPIHAIVGSIAFGAVARSVLAVEKDNNGLCLVEGIKSNLSQRIPPIGYSIVPWEHNQDIGKLIWKVVPPTLSFASADDEQSAIVEACEYLQMALADGPVGSVDLKFGAEKNGIAWRTIMRARKILRVVAIQVQAGGKSHWELSLPGWVP